MSFFEKARQAAEQARQAAAARTEQARAAATVAAHQAQIKIHEQAPILQAQTREGLGIAGSNLKVAGKSAKKGVITLVDRIDPGILADIIIKATALQEKANNSLRMKGSPYRIAEIQITAAIPPQMGFSISRIGDVEEELTGREVESAELADTLATEDFSMLTLEDVHGTDGEEAAAEGLPVIDTPTAERSAPVPIGAGDAVVGWTDPDAAADWSSQVPPQTGTPESGDGREGPEGEGAG